MGRPGKLETTEVDAWLAAHPGWRRTPEGALARAFAFADFGAAVAFTVRLGFVAERRDHHPDVLVGWGKAEVRWLTHDAGGLTRLDLELAEDTERLAG
jgi:4a-hydroxytetrahydrobiopterin dehydratase